MDVSSSLHSNSNIPHIPSITTSDDNNFLLSEKPSGNDFAPDPPIPILDSTPSAESLNRPATNLKHRQATLSTSSTKTNRTTLFNLAALARDKTSSAIASLTEPPLRPRNSSGNLHRQSVAALDSVRSSIDSASQRQERPSLPRTNSNLSDSTNLHPRTPTTRSISGTSIPLARTNPPSQAYADTNADTPSPVSFVPQGNYNKMHQTSSRLLRMTDDERPFTRVNKIHCFFLHFWEI